MPLNIEVKQIFGITVTFISLDVGGLTKSRLKNEKKNINYLRFDQLRCSLPPMRLTHRLVRGISVSGSIAAIGCVVRDHGEIFRLFVIGHWCGKRLSFSVHFSVCLWLNVALLRFLGYQNTALFSTFRPSSVRPPSVRHGCDISTFFDKSLI